MANIGVTLFADTNGNGVYDEGIDTEEGSSSTLANGEYRFVNLHQFEIPVHPILLV